MTNSVKLISFSDTIINGIKYSMKVVIDTMGKKGAFLTSEEPGKETDEVFFSEQQMTAIKYLLATKGVTQ